MKLFFRYVRQKRRLWGVGAVCCAVFAVAFWLYRLPIAAVIYPAVLCAAIGALCMAADFIRVRREHEVLQTMKTATDVASGCFPQEDSIPGEDYRQIIRLLCEEYAEYRTETGARYADMIDYYTVWAHQIKTPIASMRLQLQNEDTVLSRRLTADLSRVEQYVEMVMTFARLNSESTDYVIRACDLDAVVKRAVKKFSSEFISRRLSLHYEPLNATVVTDEKWLSFVVEQVLSNALKYTPTGSVSIAMAPEKTLCIRDTGVGIAPEDLPRVFENGYTGYNGRADQKASGIGLYLCKRICENLGHGVSIRSVVDEGTEVRIDLAQRKLEVE